MTSLRQAKLGPEGSPPGGVEVESFAPHNGRADERRTLVVASYNIRYGVGSFLISGSLGRRVGLSMPGRRPRLVAKHLGRAALAFSDGRLMPSPDILALQEADKLTHRAGRHHVARELAGGLRMDYAFAGADAPPDHEQKSKQWYLDFEERIESSDTGATGVALLSRLPLSEVSRVELPWEECAWRPRLALAATVAHRSRHIQVFNSHVDPHAEISGQLEQHRAVLSLAGKFDGPVILLGDYNTLSKRSCQAMRDLLESEGFQTPFPTGTPTWRAGLIRLHTDWIFVRGAAVKRWGVARPLGVSDHWPVWAEVEVPGDN